MTGYPPNPSDAVTQQVASGQLAPITACLALLNKAQLSGASGTTLADTSVEAKRVLIQWHRVHSSWISRKEISQIQYPTHTRDFYDSSAPALYLTRALFAPAAGYKSIVSGPVNLVAVRTDNNPGRGPASKQALSYYSVFSGPLAFAPVGELLGVKQVPDIMVQNAAKNIQVYLQGNAGGGLLGSHSYAMMTTQLNSTFKADGAVAMPRRWARDVFHDLLCRELPVVRAADVAQFNVPTATAPFRVSTSCNLCHASMDRLSATIRNLQFDANTPNDNDAFDSVRFITPNKPAESSWPASADADYYQRPPNGVLFFRDYAGNLVDLKISSTEDLGTKLKSLDDFYICAAKRYFHYLTGIEVDISDPDPAKGSLSAKHSAMRNIVIDLGKKLKTHDNPRTLISDILNLPLYKESNYGL